MHRGTANIGIDRCGDQCGQRRVGSEAILVNLANERGQQLQKAYGIFVLQSSAVQLTEWKLSKAGRIEPAGRLWVPVSRGSLLRVASPFFLRTSLAECKCNFGVSD